MSGIAITFGKFWVAATISISAFYWLRERYEDNLNDLMAPVILVMIIGYITATIFMDIYQMVVDTMIICYLTDCEQNDGQPKFSPEKLSTFIEEEGTKSAAVEQEAAKTRAAVV